MNDISTTLKSVYNAKAVIVVPGGATYAMEAVARQFATDKRCLIIRNGWFSFRWTQIFDIGDIPSESNVLKARRVDDCKHAAFVPAPIEEVVATIKAEPYVCPIRPARSVSPVAHIETICGCAVIPTIPFMASIRIVNPPIPNSLLNNVKKFSRRDSRIPENPPIALNPDGMSMNDNMMIIMA